MSPVAEPAAGGALSTTATETTLLPEIDPGRLVRFASPAEAEAHRADLVEAIWPEGFPTAVPSAEREMVWPADLAELDPQRAEAVDQIDVSVLGLDSTVYLLHPAGEPRGLGVVHHGHVPDEAGRMLDAGIADTVHMMLDRGWQVAVMQMPLAGWNRDRTLDGATISASGSAGHDELFAALEPALGPQVLRPFLEPVVQVLNLHGDGPVVMVGLSGGGWTTHLAAAVDRRIDVSVPVAGALPLFARPLSPGSDGDAEQTYPEVFAERADGRPTGLAGWVEVMALGALPEGRRQVQVLNLHDACCFSGDAHRLYSDRLAETVAGWSIHIDGSHSEHAISETVRTEVVGPLLDHATDTP